MAAPAQLGLFGRRAPAFDQSFAELGRTSLSRGAWFDYAPGWLHGHEQVFDALVESMRWHQERRKMYDRSVDVPRLYALVPNDGEGHPVLEAMRQALSARYAEPLTRVSLGYYRDGRDSVAWHGDQVARRLPTAIVATVSVGAPRRFLLRPLGGGKSLALSLGFGDLLVMGGTCQRTWQHSVPKTKRAAPRIAIMFRPAWPLEHDDLLEKEAPSSEEPGPRMSGRETFGRNGGGGSIKFQPRASKLEDSAADMRGKASNRLVLQAC